MVVAAKGEEIAVQGARRTENGKVNGSGSHCGGSSGNLLKT